MGGGMDIGEERRPFHPGEVRAMLEAYFAGPITDDVVDRLTAQVAAVLADPALHAGEIAKFHPGNGGRGFGRAWRELAAHGRTSPRSIDLAAWLAASSSGYPSPLPHCPDVYIGRWRQRPGAVHLWELGAGGQFRTDDPIASARDRWCVHRQGDGPRGDAIWLDDELGISHDSLLVIDVGPSSLTVQPVAADSPIELERVR